MWLLSTERAELHFFPSPESVPGGYAILSHVWDAEEQTFQDTQALCIQYQSPGGASPRDLASTKVKQSCILAENHGYRWLWNDTCCIDKSSSAELSEAINSMFRYYSLADVCYAYLPDVPSSTRGCYGTGSPFAESRWHGRGWTLQELVAPSIVLFISREWEYLGSKMDIAPDLETITGIPQAVLTMELKPETFSIAQRMVWASRRRTTRVEDEAYCLMGLFGINMPTLYGEESRAFHRLQEEIMKRTIDTSLFAWGYYLTDAMIQRPGSESTDDLDASYLLATSPALFKYSSNYVFRPSLHHERLWLDTSAADPVMPSYVIPLRTELRGVPTFSVSSYGVLADVPILEVNDHGRSLTYAVLFCDTLSQGSLQPLGLLLNQSPTPLDPNRTLYTIHHFLSGTCRLVKIGQYLSRLSTNGRGVTIKRSTVYLAHSRQHQTSMADHGPHILSQVSTHTPFRIPQVHLRELRAAGLEVRMPRLPSRWSGSPATTVLFEQPRLPTLTKRKSLIKIPNLCVNIGVCDNVSMSETHAGRRPHWASASRFLGDVPQDLGRDATAIRHQCPEDHIDRWHARTKAFSVNTFQRDLNFELSFTPCHMNPNTLVAHFKFMTNPSVNRAPPLPHHPSSSLPPPRPLPEPPSWVPLQPDATSVHPRTFDSHLPLDRRRSSPPHQIQSIGPPIRPAGPRPQQQSLANTRPRRQQQPPLHATLHHLQRLGDNSTDPSPERPIPRHPSRLKPRTHTRSHAQAHKPALSHPHLPDRSRSAPPSFHPPRILPTPLHLSSEPNIPLPNRLPLLGFPSDTPPRTRSLPRPPLPDPPPTSPIRPLLLSRLLSSRLSLSDPPYTTPAVTLPPAPHRSLRISMSLPSRPPIPNIPLPPVPNPPPQAQLTLQPEAPSLTVHD